MGHDISAVAVLRYSAVYSESVSSGDADSGYSNDVCSWKSAVAGDAASSMSDGGAGSSLPDGTTANGSPD